MRRSAISAFGAVLCLAFSTLFTQEVLSAEKAQRLCLVNSPSEVIACRRGDSLYYQQPGLVHGKYLLDFAAQYCDTNFEINIQFPYVLCVYSGVKVSNDKFRYPTNDKNSDPGVKLNNC